MTQAPAPEIKMPAATLLPAPHHHQSEPKQAQNKTKNQQQEQPSSSNASSSHAGTLDETPHQEQHTHQHTTTVADGSHDGVEETYNVDPADVVHNEDWKPYNDPNTGFVFWYNSATNMSQVSEGVRGRCDRTVSMRCCRIFRDINLQALTSIACSCSSSPFLWYFPFLVIVSSS